MFFSATYLRNHTSLSRGIHTNGKRRTSAFQRAMSPICASLCYGVKNLWIYLFFVNRVGKKVLTPPYTLSEITCEPAISQMWDIYQMKEQKESFLMTPRTPYNIEAFRSYMQKKYMVNYALINVCQNDFTGFIMRTAKLTDQWEDVKCLVIQLCKYWKISAW